MSSTVIAGRGLARIYKLGTVDVHALRGVDIDIADGEFTALVGPSGSGKSTLLNLLGTLDKPSAGTVRIGAAEVTSLSRTKAANFRLRNIGFVFQAYNLLPVLTAYENAEYTLLLQGRGPDERRELVEPLMRRVGLVDMMHRKPHELSGGQQQRVAVVRAIASRPAIVLADEPTANLDTETSAELLDLMKELNADDKISFLFASHDRQVVERASRVVHLVDGLIDRDERK